MRLNFVCVSVWEYRICYEGVWGTECRSVCSCGVILNLTTDGACGGGFSSSPSSSNVKLPTSESFSSSSCWVSRYQRWQFYYYYFFLQARKKGKSPCSFCFSSSRLQKCLFHVHWATSCSIFLEACWIYRALSHSLKSRLKLGSARISVKCILAGKGRGWRAVKLDRREKD